MDERLLWSRREQAMCAEIGMKSVEKRPQTVPQVVQSPEQSAKQAAARP